MSELKAVLADLIRGRDEASAILHNCRFDGAGATAYGREAILELLRTSAPTPDYVQMVRGPHCVALFALGATGSVALFADTSEDKVTRIWYLAPRSFPGSRTPRIDVPFDPTFGDLAPHMVFDPADQPDLSPAHLTRVQAWGAELLGRAADGTGLTALTNLSRLRPYVLRAFSGGDVVAVLAIVIAQRNGEAPGLVQFPIAVQLPSEQLSDATVVIDEGELEAELARTWRPVL